MKNLVVCFCALVFAIPVANGQVKIVCIGNSITEGWGLANSITQSYPARLGAMLGPEYHVLNCGASGKTMFKNVKDTYWSTGRLDIAKAFHPDIVVIALGTNDGDSFRWRPHKQEFKGDYLSMMEAFRENGRDPIFILAHCPPLFASEEQNSNIINEVIPIIHEIETEQHTYSVDFYNNLIDDRTLFPDGVHPGVSGSIKMAQILRGALTHAMVEEGQVIVNNAQGQAMSSIEINAGDHVVLDPHLADGTWAWRGSNGFSSSNKRITIDKIKMTDGGFYVGRYTSPSGTKKMVVYRISVAGCKASEITDSSWKTGSLTVTGGTDVTFNPEPLQGAWHWKGPNDFTFAARAFSLRNIKNRQEGDYIASYYNDQGCMSKSIFHLEVTGEDTCPGNSITPYVRIEDKWLSQEKVIVSAGSTIAFGPHPTQMQGWTWKGPDGFSARGREQTIKNVDLAKAGEYKAFFKDEDGCTDSLKFTVSIKPILLVTENNTKVFAQSNAAADSLYLEGLAPETNVYLENASGKTIKQLQSDSNGKLKMDVSALPRGVFYVSVDGKKRKKIKLTKR